MDRSAAARRWGLASTSTAAASSFSSASELPTMRGADILGCSMQSARSLADDAAAAADADAADVAAARLVAPRGRMRGLAGTLVRMLLSRCPSLPLAATAPQDRCPPLSDSGSPSCSSC